MKIGIIGSRERNSWEDLILVERVFAKLWRIGDLVVSGGCSRGGDKFAEMLAFKYGGTAFPDNLLVFEPDWKKHGHAAAFMRNESIARESDELIACLAPGGSRGTNDTIAKFRKLHPGNKVHIV